MKIIAAGAFKYSPLESDDKVRLLHIDYSDMDSRTLKGTILHRDRKKRGAAAVGKDDDDQVSWIAISYRWGEARDVVPMSLRFQIGGSSETTTITTTITLTDVANSYQIHNVPRSAFDTLQALHDQGCIATGDNVWIDALCINQADMVEKSAQVRVMGEIYSLASRTMVYLGPVELPSWGKNGGWID